ncbi:hypothetical protein ACIHAA_23610 [Streptomyces sp. NPDC052040]|uniref:hypothetical protein n=1 Tax=Streptomyces sp. NPDC052040 TaxID=3365682 RepID=UPI0037D2023A
MVRSRSPRCGRPRAVPQDVETFRSADTACFLKLIGPAASAAPLALDRLRAPVRLVVADHEQVRRADRQPVAPRHDRDLAHTTGAQSVGDALGHRGGPGEHDTAEGQPGQRLRRSAVGCGHRPGAAQTVGDRLLRSARAGWGRFEEAPVGQHVEDHADLLDSKAELGGCGGEVAGAVQQGEQPRQQIRGRLAAEQVPTAYAFDDQSAFGRNDGEPAAQTHSVGGVAIVGGRWTSYGVVSLAVWRSSSASAPVRSRPGTVSGAQRVQP